MPSLTVKGLPEELYDRLRRAAVENRRSINREAIVCLERALGRERIDPRARLAKIDALREGLDVPRLTDEILRQAKRTGRP
jgi:plasmid stability protein